MSKISFKKEVHRKLIHLSSLWMPLVIWLLPHDKSVVLFSILLPLSFLVEFLRSRQSKFAKSFNKLFNSMLRQHESNGFSISGATYVLVAALFCVLFFSKIVAVCALSIMLICDTAAALVGRKYGKNQIIEGKTIEGCAAFIVAGLLIIQIIGRIEGQPDSFYIAGFLAVIGALLAELFSRRFSIDDNLSIPVVAGIILMLA